MLAGLKVHRKSAHLSSCVHHNKRASFVDRGKILIATFLCLNVEWTDLSVSPSLGKRHLDPIHEIASSDVDIWILKLLSQSFPLKKICYFGIFSIWSLPASRKVLTRTNVYSLGLSFRFSLSLKSSNQYRNLVIYDILHVCQRHRSLY